MQKMGDRSAKAVARPGRPFEKLGDAVSHQVHGSMLSHGIPAVGSHETHAHFP